MKSEQVSIDPAYATDPHGLAVRGLIAAARNWAAFQDDDSVKDQETDRELRCSALVAKAYLLKAIEDFV